MTPSRSNRTRLFWGGGVVALAAAALAARLSIPEPVMSCTRDVLHLARDFGIAGTLVLATLQFLVALSGVFPASLLGVAAGSLYGLWTGFLIASLSTLIGAWLAFALGRSVWRPEVARLLARRPRLCNLDALVARDGWRMVFLLRVSPVMPFSATSYALGLSGVTTRDYMLGTLACLPALFGYVLMGALAGADMDAPDLANGWPRQLALVLGIVATLAVVWRIGRMLTASVAAADPALVSAADE